MEATDLTLGAGDIGYLEYKDYNRARWAHEQSTPGSPFMRWLDSAGHVNFAPEDVRVDSSANASIPIPATKLAHDEIARLRTELDRWQYLDSAARDQFGAFLMVELGKEVSTAMHRWPMEEKAHKVTSMTCQGCGELTLMYRPPRYEGDEIKLDCWAKCGYSASGEDLMEHIEAIREAEIDRLNDAKEVAESRRVRKATA